MICSWPGRAVDLPHVIKLAHRAHVDAMNLWMRAGDVKRRHMMKREPVPAKVTLREGWAKQRMHTTFLRMERLRRAAALLGYVQVGGTAYEQQDIPF